LIYAGDTKNSFLMNIASGTIIYFKETVCLNWVSKRDWAKETFKPLTCS